MKFDLENSVRENVERLKSFYHKQKRKAVMLGIGALMAATPIDAYSQDRTVKKGKEIGLPTVIDTTHNPNMPRGFDRSSYTMVGNTAHVKFNEPNPTDEINNSQLNCEYDKDSNSKSCDKSADTLRAAAHENKPVARKPKDPTRLMPNGLVSVLSNWHVLQPAAVEMYTTTPFASPDETVLTFSEHPIKNPKNYPGMHKEFNPTTVKEYFNSWHQRVDSTADWNEQTKWQNHKNIRELEDTLKQYFSDDISSWSRFSKDGTITRSEFDSLDHGLYAMTVKSVDKKGKVHTSSPVLVYRGPGYEPSAPVIKIQEKPVPYAVHDTLKIPVESPANVGEAKSIFYFGAFGGYEWINRNEKTSPPRAFDTDFNLNGAGPKFGVTAGFDFDHFNANIAGDMTFLNGKFLDNKASGVNQEIGLYNGNNTNLEAEVGFKIGNQAYLAMGGNGRIEQQNKNINFNAVAVNLSSKLTDQTFSPSIGAGYRNGGFGLEAKANYSYGTETQEDSSPDGSKETSNYDITGPGLEFRMLADPFEVEAFYKKLDFKSQATGPNDGFTQNKTREILGGQLGINLTDHLKLLGTYEIRDETISERDINIKEPRASVTLKYTFGGAK